MGIIELDSFCCGCCGLERGCKIIALVAACYSCLLFSLSISHDSAEEAQAAFLLLALTVLLIYGVIERMRSLVMLYLLLRAVAFLIVLAAIMRNLAEMKRFHHEKFLTVLLETGDCVMTIYFYMVVYSFCLHMDDLCDPGPHARHPSAATTATGTTFSFGGDERLMNQQRYCGGGYQLQPPRTSVSSSAAAAAAAAASALLDSPPPQRSASNASPLDHQQQLLMNMRAQQQQQQTNPFIDV